MQCLQIRNNVFTSNCRPLVYSTHPFLFTGHVLQRVLHNESHNHIEYTMTSALFSDQLFFEKLFCAGSKFSDNFYL